jgi:hypothetical protein
VTACAIHWWNPAAPSRSEGCRCRRVKLFINHREELLQPLREASGTFTGSLNLADPSLVSMDAGKVIHLYAPADLPFWKHWFYVAMERLFGWEYPTEEIYTGVIASLETRTEDGDVIVEGTFR